MTSLETYITLQGLFKELSNQNSFKQLEDLIARDGLEGYIESFYLKYPRLNFTISAEEVVELKDRKIINDDHKMDLLNLQGTTLEKLLLAALWKNGDINKISHIIDGILSVEKERSKNSLVFKQFGKSLVDVSEPIVDQHVLRAFEIGTLSEFSQPIIINLRKKAIYKSADQPILNNYKKWFGARLQNIPEVEQSDYKEKLDKVLFIKGKSVKL